MVAFPVTKTAVVDVNDMLKLLLLGALITIVDPILADPLGDRHPKSAAAETKMPVGLVLGTTGNGKFTSA